MGESPDTAFAFEVQFGAGGSARIMLRGKLDANRVGTLWPSLVRTLASGVKSIEIDAAEIRSCDSAGLAMLSQVETGGLTRGVLGTVTGLNQEITARLRGFATEERDGPPPGQSAGRQSLLVEVGITVRALAADLRAQVGFVGELVASAARSLFFPKMMRWPEVLRVVEQAGANAVPIVSLVSLLVGLVIAFESARPLAQFGARLYVGNMIGLVMVRELGPLLTGVLLAGRTGSAFAAEIGTMKINEELNALETLGLDPVRFLVIQRVFAGMLLMPLLCAYATLMGVLGGAVVMAVLGYSPPLILRQLTASVRVGDAVFGAAKGVVFGAIVAAVGCQRGLRTRQGPSAVGASTTSAVVTSIVLIIISDAAFATVYYSLLP
jgi:phospholipid/cholesterol/gamma-HCH transport system permease protein